LTETNRRYVYFVIMLLSVLGLVLAICVGISSTMPSFLGLVLLVFAVYVSVGLVSICGGVIKFIERKRGRHD
jgi:hypothetical protein